MGSISVTSNPGFYQVSQKVRGGGTRLRAVLHEETWISRARLRTMSDRGSNHEEKSSETSDNYNRGKTRTLSRTMQAIVR